MNEVDIFKHCINEPLTIKDLDSLQLIEEEEGGKTQPEKRQQRRLVSLFYKVWSGFTKFVRSQIARSRPVFSPFVGRFYPRDNGTVAAFMPCVEFIDLGKFHFQENDYNLNPYAAEAKEKVSRVSSHSIASVVGTSQDTVNSILREIFTRYVILRPHRVVPPRQEGRHHASQHEGRRPLRPRKQTQIRVILNSLIYSLGRDRTEDAAFLALVVVQIPGCQM